MPALKGSAILDQEKKSLETRLHQKFAGFSRNDFSNIEVTKADDAFIQMNGKSTQLKPGDMMMQKIYCTGGCPQSL